MTTPKTQFKSILPLIHDDHDPYRDFPKGQWTGHYNTDGSEREIFKKAIDLLKPKVIIEVGTFLGGSALFMARHIKATDSDTIIICVDTWLGGTDHLLRAREKLRPHFGRPSLYYFFMNNVLEAQMDDVIIPFPIDSMAGARFLKERGVKCQMCYVDSSHEEGDVRRDYEAYWELLESGGGLLVDDLTNWFPGVVADWTAFIKDHNLSPIMTEGEKALLIKP